MSRTYNLDDTGNFRPTNAINRYGQTYGTPIETPVWADNRKPVFLMTAEQGKLLIALCAKQLDLLESIERSLVILNRKIP